MTDLPKIDQLDAFILDIPTIRGHVLSMTTMRTQSPVIVRLHCSDGSEGIGEGTTIGGLSYCPESPESLVSAIDTSHQTVIQLSTLEIRAEPCCDI